MKHILFRMTGDDRDGRVDGFDVQMMVEYKDAMWRITS